MLINCGLGTPHGLTLIWINTGSGNGLLPDGIRPLLELMLTNYQWDVMALIWRQFHSECLRRMSLVCGWKLPIRSLPHLLGSKGLIHGLRPISAASISASDRISFTTFLRIIRRFWSPSRRIMETLADETFSYHNNHSPLDLCNDDLTLFKDASTKAWINH